MVMFQSSCARNASVEHLCDVVVLFCSVAMALHGISTQCGILDSFNERLHKLEDTIRPIHDETTKLKTLQGSIFLLLQAVWVTLHGQIVHKWILW